MPGETLYYSPGAIVVHKDDSILITFPRAHIDQPEPKVDIDSSLNEDGTRSVTIPVVIKQERSIEISINGEKPLGPWKLAGEQKLPGKN